MSDAKVPTLPAAERKAFLESMRFEAEMVVGQLVEALSIDIAVGDERSAKPRREALDMHKARLKEIEKRLADLAKTGTSPTP